MSDDKVVCPVREGLRAARLGRHLTVHGLSLDDIIDDDGELRLTDEAQARLDAEGATEPSGGGEHDWTHGERIADAKVGEQVQAFNARGLGPFAATIIRVRAAWVVDLSVTMGNGNVRRVKNAHLEDVPREWRWQRIPGGA